MMSPTASSEQIKGIYAAKRLVLPSESAPQHRRKLGNPIQSSGYRAFNLLDAFSAILRISGQKQMKILRRIASPDCSTVEVEDPKIQFWTRLSKYLKIARK